MIISYKRSDNVFVIYLFNLDDRSIIFRHQSIHMWEYSIFGLLLSTSEYLTITKDCINVMGLRSRPIRREMVDFQGNNVVLHCLQECQYLKLNHLNILNFYEYVTKEGEQVIDIYI